MTGVTFLLFDHPEPVPNSQGEDVFPTSTQTDTDSLKGTVYDIDFKLRVHDYMEDRYIEMTNNWENYDPEEHDPVVERLASMEFGITPEEAEMMYLQGQ